MGMYQFMAIKTKRNDFQPIFSFISMCMMIMGSIIVAIFAFNLCWVWQFTTFDIKTNIFSRIFVYFMSLILNFSPTFNSDTSIYGLIEFQPYSFSNNRSFETFRVFFVGFFTFVANPVSPLSFFSCVSFFIDTAFKQITIFTLRMSLIKFRITLYAKAFFANFCNLFFRHDPYLQSGLCLEAVGVI